MAKPVWFPFYPSDFLASNKVAVMTNEEIGTYLLLLCREWEDPNCALPNDDELLQKLSRFSGNLMNIKACFTEKDGVLINERLYAEWKKAKRISRLKKKAGRVGMHNRWDNRPITPVITEPITKHNQSQSHPQSQSPSESESSSDSESEKKKKTKISSEGKTLAGLSGVETWNAYALGFQRRYGVAPVRNAKTNGVLKRLVERLGAVEAPQVAAFYCTHASALYVRSKHCVDLLLRDAEGLRMEWATGRQITNLTAQQSDRTSTTGQIIRELMAEKEAKHG